MEIYDNVRETREGYNSIASRYFNKWHKLDFFQKLHLERFADRVGNGARILDAGCGTGKDSHYLCQIGLNVVGLDISESMLRKSREVDCDGRISVVLGDMRYTPFADSTFRGVWTNSALVHLQNKREALEEFDRLLEPEGMLHICVQNGEHPFYVQKQNESGDTKRMYAFYDKRHWFYPNLPELKTDLTIVGFKPSWLNSRKARWLRVYARKK